jgi:hypothetical protein
MDVVIRPPTPEDAEGLAKASRDLGEQYRKLEPHRFQVPERAALLQWLAETLTEPVPDDELWLVAELDGEAVGDAQAQLREPVANAAIQRDSMAVGGACTWATWRFRPSTEGAGSAVAY